MYNASFILLLTLATFFLSGSYRVEHGVSAESFVPCKLTDIPKTNREQQQYFASDRVVSLEGQRKVLPELCYESWSNSATRVLAGRREFGSRSLGFVVEWTESEAIFWGRCSESKANRALREYVPSKFLAQGEKVPKSTLSLEKLKEGVDLEIPGPDDTGIAILRLELRWNGLCVGVITGWEFALEAEKLYVLDTQTDGAITTDDSMVYGDRRLAMPWHSVTSSGNVIYFDVRPGAGGKVEAKTRQMEKRGEDTQVWDQWQVERKNQGLPPGIFSPKLQKQCERHAEYCQKNNYKGPLEDETKPGFSLDGQSAGKTSELHFLGRKRAKDGLAELMIGLYSRARLLDPKDVTLQLGGNEFAFLMGAQVDSDLPTESRVIEEVQLFPAPQSSIANGVLKVEATRHPVFDTNKTPGLPVFIRLPNEQMRLDEVSGNLWSVAGDMSTGKRGEGIQCCLSYANHNAPADLPSMRGIVALIPTAKLKPGIYEVEFTHQHRKQKDDGFAERFSRTWRFEVLK